jgi:hypothetical protein
MKKLSCLSCLLSLPCLLELNECVLRANNNLSSPFLLLHQHSSLPFLPSSSSSSSNRVKNEQKGQSFCGTALLYCFTLSATFSSVSLCLSCLLSFPLSVSLCSKQKEGFSFSSFVFFRSSLHLLLLVMLVVC